MFELLTALSVVQWKSNLLAISRSAMSQTITVNQLVDMEWRFGVTASSSEMQKVGSSFLQLKLLLNKGNKTEDVFIGEVHVHTSTYTLQYIHKYTL